MNLLFGSTIEQIATVLGGIDALINNAGEIVVGPLDAMGREDFKDALDIHFWAPFNVTFASYPICLRAVSPELSISPLSEAKWPFHI